MTDVLLECARQYIKNKGQSWPDRTADTRAPYSSWPAPPPDGEGEDAG